MAEWGGIHGTHNEIPRPRHLDDQCSGSGCQCPRSGLGWLEVKGSRSETKANIPLDAIRRPGTAPIWKLGASLKWRSYRKGRYAPPVHMVWLTAVAPYKWGIRKNIGEVPLQRVVGMESPGASDRATIRLDSPGVIVSTGWAHRHAG
jgi:hypothetical protein